MYGIVDLGVEHINNVGPAKGTVTWMPAQTNSAASRLGFRGVEDLGGGLRGLFTLEMGILADSGSLAQGGRAFGRHSFVGLAGPWGQVTLGRQLNATFWVYFDAEPLGGNIYSLTTLDSYLGPSRSDNTIAYRGTFGGLTALATYSLGRDALSCPGESSTDHKACKQVTAMLKYDWSSGGVAVAYDSMRGRTPTGPTDALSPPGLNSSDKTDTRLHLTGYARFGQAKIGAGVRRRDNEGDSVKPRSNIWFVGAAYPLTPQVTLDGEVAVLRYSAAPEFNARFYAVRAQYALSKRTSVYAQVGHISNSSSSALSISTGQGGGSPAPGNSQTGFHTGIRHHF
jgi:predicted porin